MQSLGRDTESELESTNILCRFLCEKTNVKKMLAESVYWLNVCSDVVDHWRENLYMDTPDQLYKHR